MSHAFDLWKKRENMERIRDYKNTAKIELAKSKRNG